MTNAAASESSTEGHRGSFRGKAWFWAPIVPLVALDLWSKAASFRYLAERFPLRAEVQRVAEDVDFLFGPFRFALVAWRNTGTIWGLGQDFTSALMILRTAALGLLVFLAWRTSPQRKMQLLVLGLIFSGAVGNLYDNFFMADSGVRDFLRFSYVDGDGGLHHFPAFNIADSCISVGAVMLALLLWRQPDDSKAGAVETQKS